MQRSVNMKKGFRAPKSRGEKHPPQLRTNVIVKHRYRFTSTDGAAQTIVDSDVVGILGGVCRTANSVLSLLAASAKIHSVEIWSPPASQGAAATCSLEWASTDFSPTIEVSDTSVSVSEPAHIVAVPPSGSEASFWMAPGGGKNIMIITAPAGSIIDVRCSHVLADAGTEVGTYAVAAGTLGALYYLPLDGASDKYIPVSLTTTT